MISYIYTFLIGIIVIPLFVVAAIILIIVSLFARPILFWVSPYLSRLMLFLLGVQLKIEGQFPDNGPYIIMANHSSFIDIFLIPSVIKGRFTAVAAKFNYRYPVYAQLLKSFRIIPIDRGNRSNSFKGIKTAETLIRKKGYHVVILPEGTRTLTGKMGKLKKGGFHMAVNTSTAILPIGIQGAYDYKPQDRSTLKPGKVKIRIGKLVDTNQYEDLELEELMNRVESDLKELSGEEN